MTQEADIASLKTSVIHVHESLSEIKGQLGVLVQLVGRVDRVEHDVTQLNSRVEIVYVKVDGVSRDTVLKKDYDEFQKEIRSKIQSLETWKYGVVLVCTIVTIFIPTFHEFIKYYLK